MRKGANVNAACSSGITVLMDACCYNLFDTAKLLIEKGADVNAREMCGNTALMYVAENKSLNEKDCIKLMKLLIEYGADVNVRGKHNETALLQALKQKRFAIAKFLLKNGASIFVMNRATKESVIGYLIKYKFEKIRDFVRKIV